jgi:trimethylamine--corrinoid protein Co-methyltransferase
MALRLVEGIELRDDPVVPLELMREGIERKSFLSLAHTMKWFRKEAYFPDEVIDRNALDEWHKQGSKDAAARAAERVEKILAAHTSEPLDREVSSCLVDIMTAEAKRFGLKKLP